MITTLIIMEMIKISIQSKRLSCFSTAKPFQLFIKKFYLSKGPWLRYALTIQIHLSTSALNPFNIS